MCEVHGTLAESRRLLLKYFQIIYIQFFQRHWHLVDHRPKPLEIEHFQLRSTFARRRVLTPLHIEFNRICIVRCHDWRRSRLESRGSWILCAVIVGLIVNNIN